MPDNLSINGAPADPQPERITQPALIPYTLRIGVVAHRDVANLPKVTSAVERALSQLRSTLESFVSEPCQPLTCGDHWLRLTETCLVWRCKRMLAKMGIRSARAPLEVRQALNWRVVSSLAEGAERIVAGAALEQLGVPVEEVWSDDQADPEGLRFTSGPQAARCVV